MVRADGGIRTNHKGRARETGAQAVEILPSGTDHAGKMAGMDVQGHRAAVLRMMRKGCFGQAGKKMAENKLP